jgi:hypothetical protein
MNNQHAPANRRTAPPNPESDYGRRIGILITGVVILTGLALFTVPAFWEHIDSLAPAYPIMARVGVVTGEAMLFALLFWQAFDKSMKVRHWALIWGIILAIVVLVHSAALWGLKDGVTRQTAKEKALTEGLSKLSNDQMGSASGRFRTQTQRQIASETRKELADEIKNRDKSIHAATFAPEWYLNGPMYLAIFLFVMFAHSHLTYLHFNAKPEHIDRNFDGVADIHQQPAQPQRTTAPLRPVPTKRDYQNGAAGK